LVFNKFQDNSRKFKDF